MDDGWLTPSVNPPRLQASTLQKLLNIGDNFTAAERDSPQRIIMAVLYPPFPLATNHVYFPDWLFSRTNHATQIDLVSNQPLFFHSFQWAIQIRWRDLKLAQDH